MVQPIISQDAQSALAALGPWGVADDASTDWALSQLLDALLGEGQLQDVDDWARDDPTTGAPGWSSWMDPTKTPSLALGWLGQFVGVGPSSAGGAAVNYKAQVLANNPVAYWPLTDAVGSATAMNVVGSGDGTVYGAVFGQPGFVASDPSQMSAHFDGATTRIETGAVAWAQATNFSVVISFVDTTGTAGQKIIARLGSWWSVNMGLGANGTISLEDCLGHYVRTTASFQDRLPHRVIVTMGTPASLANISIYVDGVLQATTSSGAWAPSNPANPTLAIGANNGGGVNFGGNIGQVAICNTVLTATQVAVLNAAATAISLGGGPALTDAQQRTAIQAQLGTQRGRPAAIVAAIKPLLTGDQTVVLNERYGGDAYALQVITYAGQTPNIAAVFVALLSQKPGGIILTYIVSPGITWTNITGTWAAQTETWSALTS